MKGLSVPGAEVLRKESTAWSWVCCGSDSVENHSQLSVVVRRSKHGVSILFGLGSEAVEMVVMNELEIGEGVVHLVNGDVLERRFGVGEGVVDDKGDVVGDEASSSLREGMTFGFFPS
ncbi:hypothetical protein PanWU01x14_359020 [Parasponia andersonii]|uniref:Uncharacterized protein n=1 Tax=Parasponia andersonii TaxID=3476 RepID=A0A2P5A860_PARAD|nr:hypothetical protein PanWU01x14_359020 [Parasponia andersonii]